MIELITLGATELRRDEVDVHSVLSQPKRLALLAYLRLAAPGGFVSRDRLLALLWPESTPERARNSLRQSLHFLRRSLGEDVVIARAEHEVGVDPKRLSCDAVAFVELLEAGRLAEGMALYGGELLPGLFVEEVPELERWIETERASLAGRAVAAARSLSEALERDGDLEGAARWAQRAVELDPLGEAGTRRLMALLARSGERARALEAFDELQRRLGEELEMEPSPETIRLAAEIRAGEGTAAVTALAPGIPASAPPEPAPGVGRDLSTPPRVGRPAAGPPDSGWTGRSRWRPALRVAVPAVVLVAVAAVVAPRLAVRPAPSVPEHPAIAVLPFLDMSADRDREYFADGVAEELLNVLAQVPGLRVAARTSSFAFRGRDVTADSIGRVLNVTHVLEGSVRTDGTRARITAQLIETASGFHLWSATYDRDLDDLFAVQGEISREIVRELRLRMAGGEGAPGGAATPDPEAHRLYLQGRYAWNRRTGSSIRTAMTRFQEALDIDPAYARAWAALADAMIIYPQYAGEPREAWYEKADAAASRAIELDPSMAEPHATLGFRFSDDAGEEATRHFREAIDLNPNYATAHHWLSIHLGGRGDYEGQLRSIRQARSLDPLSPIIQLNEGKALIHLRRFDEAVATYREITAMEPGFGFGHAVLAEALALAGRPDEAAASARRALEILGDEAHGEALAAIGYALGRAGQATEARRIARLLEQKAEIADLRPGGYGPAEVYAGLGDTGRALEWLERAVVGHHFGGRPDLPYFDDLRDHADFDRIRRRFDG